MISFRALPEEVESWTELAEADGRSLSNWIRLKVNKSLEDNKPTTCIKRMNQHPSPMKLKNPPQPRQESENDDIPSFTDYSDKGIGASKPHESPQNRSPVV